MITLHLTADISSLINCLNVNLTYFCALNIRSAWRLNELLNEHFSLQLALVCCDYVQFGERDTDHTCSFFKHSLKRWSSRPFILSFKNFLFIADDPVVLRIIWDENVHLCFYAYVLTSIETIHLLILPGRFITAESSTFVEKEKYVLVSPELELRDWSCVRLVYQISGSGSLQLHLRPEGENFDYTLWTAEKPSDSWLIASVDLRNTSGAYQVFAGHSTVKVGKQGCCVCDTI